MANLQEEKDLENNISISARRFEESPFIERHDTSQMVRGVYANRFFAVYNGEDYMSKYWTLRRKALIFDVPEKPIEISGPDAVPFLDKNFNPSHFSYERRSWLLRACLYATRWDFYGRGSI